MNRIVVRSLVAGGLLGAGVQHAACNPSGGVVTYGNAGITTAPGTVTIDQTSQVAIINWQTFSIGAGELTKFVQPSATSAALNRVLGGGTSMIAGTLQANGQVVLINGNGIVVTSSGLVNTNGFIASTRDVTDSDYLTGNWHFTGSGTAGVANSGTITAANGNVYLIGKTVDNEGSINAPNGTAGLASGDDVLLTTGYIHNVYVSPSPTATAAAGQTAVHNAGTITSATAELSAANGNLFALAINNAGTVRATQIVTGNGGRIFLTADSGQIQNNGKLISKCGTPGSPVTGGTVRITDTAGSVWNRQTIDASGTYGGKVYITAQNVQNDGMITTAGTAQTGGIVSIEYTGNAIGSVTGMIDASGAQTGGTIEILGLGANSEAYLSETLNVNATLGGAGNIYINGPTIYLTDASLSASGMYGGTILVGAGDPLAAIAPAPAGTLYISPGTTLVANGHGGGGFGGTVTATGTRTTVFQGFAQANGGTHAPVGAISITGVTPITKGSTTYAGTKTLVVGSGGGSTDTGTSKTSATLFEFVDPDPGPDNAFGRPFTGVYNLTSNTTLITSPGDSFGGAGAGAVYLFNSVTGALLSTLRGSDAGDGAGTSVSLLSGSTFAILTPGWSDGAGAVSFGTGKNGFFGGGGSISAANSLVGSAAGDGVGSGGIVPLVNGDDVVLSPNWNQGAGAVTWVDPRSGVTGVVSSTNSLLGASAGDAIGSGGIVQLNNGVNYLVLSPDFDGGAGAITNCSNGSGRDDTVSTFNSLVGASTSEHLGTEDSIIDTTYGYYLVTDASYGDGAGAVTWNASNIGTTGVVGAGNSLVGSSSTDAIGSGGIVLLPIVQNYVVLSPSWSGGTGAVTFGNGSSGISGAVGAGNSLVGSQTSDHLGSGGVTVLGNGNYAVLSPDWNNATGAVTLASAGFGVSGAVSSSNSYVGASAGDQVGSGGISSVNGATSVILSPNFDDGAGAVTQVLADFSPFNAPAGVVSSSNSLVGAAAGDHIGSDGVVNIANGYLVLSPDWNGGRGAITENLNSAALTGVVSSANSLVGASASDHVGVAGTVVDSGSNYFLVDDPGYDNGAGAVTYGGENSPTIGVVGAGNSLVGSSPGDAVGSGGVVALPNSSYIVLSPDWNSGAGAVTLGGQNGIVAGVVGGSNSLIGSASGDHIGSAGVVSVGSGSSSYAVLSPEWNGGRGALTIVSANANVTGTVSASNSLVGAAAGDAVGAAGSITHLSGGDFVVTTASYDGGAGAVTWSDPSNPTTGMLSAENSLVGTGAGDDIGSGGLVQVSASHYVILSPDWNDGAGAVTNFNAGTGVAGVLSASNSLVGANAGDGVGSAGSILLPNASSSSYYLVQTSNFAGGAGAVTWNSPSGQVGVISSANSLVGSSTSDAVGSGGVTFLGNKGYVVLSPNWNGNAGAVSQGSAGAGVSGVVGTTNSLVGATGGDQVGDGGVQVLNNGNYLVLSPDWSSGTGAVTFVNTNAGKTGVVSASNSLVGSAPGDGIGSGGLYVLPSSGSYLVFSPDFDDGRGAVTFGTDTAGISGVVSPDNSLVGANEGDYVGSGGVVQLTNGDYLIQSPLFNDSAGAVTWGSDVSGVTGVVTSANSITGGVRDAGEQFAGESADGSVYYVSFTTDTSNGGDGRVLAGSVNGPTGVPASSFSTAQLFQQAQVLTVEASDFNFLSGVLDFYISDPNTPGHDQANVEGTGAVNDGSASSLASGSSSAKMSGPQRLLLPGNGIWNIFGGSVYSTPPPPFVSEQLKLNLSPQVFSHLNELLFGHL
jgi:filamentous hemagglutinin family protein